jgi:serine/threonine-protein kinase
MNATGKCPQCGHPLSADAAGGLCLNCLAHLGAAGPKAPTGDETVVLPPPTLPGPIRYFGDYELIEEPGRGGMGVVYRARQVSLDRPVAVKVILTGPFASEEFLHRFRSEAETIARFHHPNIVTIYEVGEHEGQPYFSMEYVPGATLAERVRSEPLSPREAARTLATVARAIRHAHDHGVLHRDLKPSNVLLDERGAPRVTDFGVAKRLERPEGITITGQTLGTPAYIPPEQIAAKRGAVTVRSDVYSLGAILYYLLMARPPFLGETVAETLQAVLERDPPPPRSLNRGLPADIETICLRCLAKEPSRRYASAAALAGDLERWLQGEPIHARRVGGAERLWLWVKRRPAVAALSALSALALAAGSSLPALTARLRSGTSPRARGWPTGPRTDNSWKARNLTPRAHAS